MSRASTRAAPLTPVLPAGVAVVGLIGPDAFSFLEHVFRPRSSSSASPTSPPWSEDRLRLGQIVDGEEVIDDAIVAARTDEDGVGHVEFTTHGGPRIVQRLLLTLERHGAMIVPAGEIAAGVWPCRAEAAGVDREVYERLPYAPTRRAAAWLLRQRELLPAAIEGIIALLGEMPSAAMKKIGDLVRTRHAAERMLHGFSVAIIGPPNAGKSTLANALCGRDRVLVSDTPGTTRDYITEPAAVEGAPVTLIDTAGLRHSEDAIEVEAVARAREQAARADLRILVLDAAVPLSNDSRELLREFTPSGPSLLALGKTDLPSVVQPIDLPGEWSCGAVAVSAANGRGLDLLRSRIVAAAGISSEFDGRAALFTERQAALARQALSVGPENPEGVVKGLNELVRGRKLA